MWSAHAPITIAAVALQLHEKYLKAFAFDFPSDFGMGIESISKITGHDFEKHLTDGIVSDE